MWRLTLALNTALMFVVWGIATGLISIAHNRLVVYPPSNTEIPLPSLTSFIFSIHPYFIVLPLAWMALSIGTYHHLKNKSTATRNEFLLAFSLATQTVAAAIVFVYLISGTLPFLLIGDNLS